MIEVAVILVVAAIILPVIILPFVEGVRDLEKPVIRGNLAFLAQEEMEKKVICRSYYDVVSWNNATISGFPGYSSSCTVDDTAAYGAIDEDVKDVSLTVTEESTNESITLVTVKTLWNYGMPAETPSPVAAPTPAS